MCLTLTEDVDPSVGRFRNMVQTAVVPMKVAVLSTLFCLLRSVQFCTDCEKLIVFFFFVSEEES